MRFLLNIVNKYKHAFLSAWEGKKKKVQLVFHPFICISRQRRAGITLIVSDNFFN